MRSIRSSSRAHTTEGQRGFALILAIGLAIVFFMLVQLILIDSARELKEARRFRAKIVASTLAENAAELAATQITTRNYAVVNSDDWQGKIHGEMQKTTGGESGDPNSGPFVIKGEGTVKGPEPASATVRVQGSVSGQRIQIEYTLHSQ